MLHMVPPSLNRKRLNTRLNCPVDDLGKASFIQSRPVNSRPLQTNFETASGFPIPTECSPRAYLAGEKSVGTICTDWTPFVAVSGPLTSEADLAWIQSGSARKALKDSSADSLLRCIRR
jgi:hypothetical protein